MCRRSRAGPFLTLPTSCEGPQPFTIHGVGTWEDEAARAEASVVSHNALDRQRVHGLLEPVLRTVAVALPGNRRGGHSGGAGRGRDVPPGSAAGAGRARRSDDQEHDRVVARRPRDQSGPGRGSARHAREDAGEAARRRRAGVPARRRRWGPSKFKTPLLEGAFESELTATCTCSSSPAAGRANRRTCSPIPRRCSC